MLLESLLVLFIPPKEYVYVRENPPIVRRFEQREISAYTLSKDETDSREWEGAWGDDLRCAAKMQRICASRSLPRGTQVVFPDFTCTILDKTSKKYADVIDILVKTKAEARKFGRQTMIVEIIYPL